MRHRPLADDQEQFKEWLRDPKKLLELIAAAEGRESAGEPGAGSGPAGAGAGRGPANLHSVGRAAAPKRLFERGTGHGNDSASSRGLMVAPKGALNQHESAAASDEEIYGILSALTSFGQIGAGGTGGMSAAGMFHEQMSQLPGGAQDTLKRAIAGLAAQASDAKPDEHVLVQLAEHLAIRYALERYERGDMQVNAVRQMLDRMNQEIESLRKILETHEDKMSAAGLAVESHREILDRQFWARGAGKREAGRSAFQ